METEEQVKGLVSGRKRKKVRFSDAAMVKEFVPEPELPAGPDDGEEMCCAGSTSGNAMRAWAAMPTGPGLRLALRADDDATIPALEELDPEVAAHKRALQRREAAARMQVRRVWRVWAVRCRLHPLRCAEEPQPTTS